MEPLPYFQQFLDRFLWFEYHRRHTPEQAQENMRVMLRTTHRDAIYEQANIRRVNFDLNEPGPGDWPVEEGEDDDEEEPEEEEEPGARVDQNQNEIGLRRERKTSEDSDDSWIDMPRSAGRGIPNYAYPIARIRRLWTYFARREVHDMWQEGKPMKLETVLNLFAIRQIARESNSKWINLPFDCLTVTIGCRKVTFHIRNSRTNEEVVARYWWDFDGCIVWYGTMCTMIPGIKYQSKAAKDFYFLVQNPNLTIKNLRFDIERFSKKKTQLWPFTSFYWKIEKYLASLGRKLKVKEFRMKFFERRCDRTSEMGLVKTVLPYLEPGTLETISLFVWRNLEPRYYVNLVHIYESEQWKQCKNLDIYDNRLRINRHEELQHFETITMFLPRDDIERLLLVLINYKPTEQWYKSVSVQTGIDVDLALDRVEVLYHEGTIPEDINFYCYPYDDKLTVLICKWNHSIIRSI